MKRVIAAVLATFMLLASFPAVVLAADGYIEPPVIDEGKYDESGGWVSPNKNEAYATLESTGTLGLKNVDYSTIDEMRAAADTKSTLPSIDEVSKLSADKVNLDAQKALYGMGDIVDYMNTKQITIGDFEAIAWSYIISQFAEPYQENIQDVLSNAIFKQMVEQDLEIEQAPADVTSGAVSWNEVWQPNTKVADKVKFSKIAEKIYSKTEHLVLLDGSGTQQVTLNKFLTAPLGTVFYIADQKVTMEGVDNKTLWDKRSMLFSQYGRDLIRKSDFLIPIYVSTNATQIQNQINFTSFIKSQVYQSKEGAVTSSFNTVGAPGGSMGSAKMYVDQFGNLCVYHNNKMKIVLCNAQNTILTSRPDEDDEFSDTINTVHGNTITSEEIKRITEIPLVFTQPDSITGDQTGGGTGTDAPADLQKKVEALYTSEKGSKPYTLQSNESLNFFSKPMMTVYSRMVSTGAWNGDQSIHFAGDGATSDYGAYIQFEVQAQGARRNQVVIAKPPGVYLENEVPWSRLRSDKTNMLTEKKAITEPGSNIHNSLKELSNSKYRIIFDYAVKDQPTLPGWGYDSEDAKEPVMLEYNLKADLEGKLGKSAWETSPDDESDRTPTQSILFSYNNAIFGGMWESSATSSSSITRSIPYSTLLYTAENTGADYHISNYIKNTGTVKNQKDTEDPVYDVSKELRYAALTAYNHSYVVLMGGDPGASIPKIFAYDQAGGNGEMGKRYSMGSLLVSTLDYGQFWSQVNEALDPDYIAGMASGENDTYKISFDTMPSDDNTLQIKPGLLLPFNKITWTASEKDYSRLKQYLVSDAMEKDPGTLDSKILNSQTLAEGNVGKVKFEEHFFTDNIYLLMRDTRISDKWQIYGKEDVSLVSYVWLNYYLPKSLFMRTFIDGSYEESPMFQEFYEGYITGVMSDTALSADAALFNKGNVPSEKDKTVTKNIDGSTNTKWRDATIIMGPYLELMGATPEQMEYKFYPDCSPYPSAIEQVTLADGASLLNKEQTSTGKQNDKLPVTTVADYVTVNTYDLLMGLYCNTHPEVNVLTGLERGPEDPTFSKTDILQGLWQMVRYPGQSFVSLLSTFMQYLHGTLAGSTFANFFQLNWIFGTGVWQSVMSYYFIIMLGFIAVSSIFLFFNLVVDKKHGLGVTCKRLIISLCLCVCPLIIINTMVIVTDKITKDQLGITLDKASVAETAAYATGLANANAKFEYSYQLFRDQFESIEDTICEYGYQIPKSYLTGLDQYTYTNRNLQETVRGASWVENQTKQKWYDYRAFVPVNKEKYATNMYYYFYDYMKWQYLQYLAGSSADASVKLGERAKEYRFGFDDSLTVPQTEAEVQQYLEDCQKLALDPDSKFLLDNDTNGSDKAKYIEALEKTMLSAKGDFVVMMNDPRFIYGYSFTEEGYKAVGGYKLDDMFGLGYLLTDTKEDSKYWEPSNELKNMIGWPQISKDSTLSEKKAKNSDVVGYQNSMSMINDLDETTQKACPGIKSRDGQVFGSELSLKQYTEYNKNVYRGMPMSPLETKLDKLNKDIYQRCLDLTKFYPAETPSETYLSLCAMAATFEFHKEFGGKFTSMPLEPTGYLSQTVTFDSALRGIFARSPNDILMSRQLMYMLVDNSGGFGLVTCFLLVLADLMAFMMAIARNLLTVLIFIFSVGLCVFTYMIKQKKRSTILLGIGMQCGGLIFTHFLMTAGLGLLTRFSAGAMSAWKDALIALILLLLLSADAFIHYLLILAIKRDFMNMGGNFFAEKISGVFDKIKANMGGKAAFKDSKIEGDINKKQLAKKQQQQLASQQRMNKKLQALKSKSTDDFEGSLMDKIAGGVATASGMGMLYKMAKKAKFMKLPGAGEASSGGLDVSDAQRGGFASTMNAGVRTLLGNDGRFNAGATVGDQKLQTQTKAHVDRTKKREQQILAQMETADRQLNRVQNKSTSSINGDRQRSGSETIGSARLNRIRTAHAASNLNSARPTLVSGAGVSTGSQLSGSARSGRKLYSVKSKQSAEDTQGTQTQRATLQGDTRNAQNAQQVITAQMSRTHSDTQSSVMETAARKSKMERKAAAIKAITESQAA